MDPSIKAILVGCSQRTFPQVSRVLEACSISIAAKYPDARSAIDATRLSQGEKVLCIMHVASEDQVQQLRWLRECFIGRPLVTLVDRHCDSALLFAISRVGGGPVLPLPLEADDLATALQCMKSSQSAPLPVAGRRVLAVSGASGGCGATILALNLGYEIATKFNLSCILVDLARCGMAAVCLDVEIRNTLADLLLDMRSIDAEFVERALVPITNRFRILPAPRPEDEPLRASSEDVVQLLEVVKQLADVVILDLPIHSDVRFEAFACVNQVLLIAEQTVPSIRALSTARTILDPIETVRQTPVINRYNPKIEEFTVSQLQRLLKAPQVATVANDYLAVSGAMNEGKPLRLHAPSSRVVADIHALARMQVTPVQLQGQVKEVKAMNRFTRLVRSLVS